MIPRKGVLIKPVGGEYTNVKKVGGVNLLVNTSIEDVDYVNRLGEVVSSPDNYLKKGNIVLVHHNVFRTYYDMKGNKRRSNEYFRDGVYLVSPDRIYLYKTDNDWKAYRSNCFVTPVDYVQHSDLHRTDEKEEKHVGIVKYSNTFKPGTKVGFAKNSEYKFVVDDEKLYKMRDKDICINFD